MSWLFGRAPSAKPAWADDLSGRDYKRLREAIELQLLGSGLTYSWEDGDDHMRVELSEEHVGVARFEGLANKYRLATDLERPLLVADHMNAILSNDPLPETWDAAGPVLKAALVVPDYLGGEEVGGLYRPITTEFGAVLMLDLPKSMHTVLPPTFEKWGIPMEDAWQTGIANVHGEPNIQEEQTPLRAGVRVHAIFGANRFGSARALALPRYLDPDPKFGALVGVPSASELLCHTIRSQAYEIARDFLHRVTADLFNGEEIDRLSPHVYWWLPSGWTRLTTIEADDRIVWDPPDSFRAMADSLAPAA